MTKTEAPRIDAIAFRNACGAFGTGVTLITTRAGNVEHGMTANAFMSISLDPPLIAVSVARSARMLGYIESAGRFAVSILSAGSEATAMHFAGRPDPALTDPLHEFDGMPVARQACAVFAARVDQQITAGDHVIFIGLVTAMTCEAAAEPLIFHRGRFGQLHREPAGAGTLDPEALWGGSHW